MAQEKGSAMRSKTAWILTQGGSIKCKVGVGGCGGREVVKCICMSTSMMVLHL
jgi:hypothetical protein